MEVLNFRPPSPTLYLNLHFHGFTGYLNKIKKKVQSHAILCLLIWSELVTWPPMSCSVMNKGEYPLEFCHTFLYWHVWKTSSWAYKCFCDIWNFFNIWRFHFSFFIVIGFFAFSKANLIAPCLTCTCRNVPLIIIHLILLWFYPSALLSSKILPEFHTLLFQLNCSSLETKAGLQAMTGSL